MGGGKDAPLEPTLDHSRLPVHTSHVANDLVRGFGVVAKGVELGVVLHEAADEFITVGDGCESGWDERLGFDRQVSIWEGGKRFGRGGGRGKGGKSSEDGELAGDVQACEVFRRVRLLQKV